MTRKFHLITLALVAAAVAAPISQASPPAKVDPLAVSYLRGQGFSPSQIQAWTVGVCSYQVKPAACFGPSKGSDLAGTRAKVDPLAVSYLRGQGFSPSQTQSWTVGACSHQVKPAACFGPSKGAAPTSTPLKVDPLAVSYLRSLGLSTSEITDWTVGACSHEVKPATCYAAFDRTGTRMQGGPSVGFDWADAGIGAGATLGLVLLALGLGFMLITRVQRRDAGRLKHV